MTPGEALIWFVITTFGLVALLAFGMYEGTHSYSAKDRRHHRFLRHHTNGLSRSFQMAVQRRLQIF